MPRFNSWLDWFLKPIVVGTQKGDVLSLEGNGLPGKIFGRGGNDTIIGGNRSDLLFGGWGQDDISGGRGHDEVFGGNGLVYTSDAAGQASRGGFGGVTH